MSEDPIKYIRSNEIPNYEIKCKSCGAPKKYLDITCTKPGMFISYFHVICTLCDYEYDDRWADEAL